MTPAQPEALQSATAARASYRSPLASSGAGSMALAICSRAAHLASVLFERSSGRRQWTVMAQAPAATSRLASAHVAAMSTPQSSPSLPPAMSDPKGTSRIFALTGIERPLARVETMATARSGLVSNTAPMPPRVLKASGQPMFRSMAATSPLTFKAAASADAGSALPSWHTTRPRSSAHVRSTTWPFGSRKSTLPRLGFSTRVDLASFLSMISSVQALVAP
mmetsp:Transcript_66092/g.149180  ORF Transcript_66092/g.149180 Transcript_66092/m.149180 type:complete len:221 (-) Transcript_66092:117-779(-)